MLSTTKTWLVVVVLVARWCEVRCHLVGVYQSLRRIGVVCCGRPSRSQMVLRHVDGERHWGDCGAPGLMGGEIGTQ